MAVRAGQILHAMNTFVIDRIQTGGAGTLNIPQTKVYEVGNYQSVGIVRDTPDLTFNLDCLDVSTEVEAILTGSAAPGTDLLGTNGTTGTLYDLSNYQNVDIISPFKSAYGAFDVVRGVAIPYLTVEAASYRYGVKADAAEQFTLRGDSIYYIPGTPYQENFVGDGTVTVFTYAHTALLYTEQGVAHYALCVTVNGVRKVQGTDYTSSATAVTFTTPPPAASKVRIVYGSSVAATYSSAVHEGTTVKPAAIRGKDIQVYVGGTAASPFRWSDVQSVQVDWKVSLQSEFEFGNPNAVSREATDVPAVSGNIGLLPITAGALFTKLNQITGVTSTDIVGPQSSVLLPLQIRLANPDSGGTSAQATGVVLKTLFIPDARFTIPGYEGRANQQLTSTLPFESDSGTLKIYKGLGFSLGY